jgi:hypothetical protein
MALPDPHADEPTVEVDRDTVKLMLEAKANAKAWTAEYDRLRRKFEAELGDAYAATVDGEKVLTYRPRTDYAAARIIKDYPDLAAHFFEYKTENTFNVEKFALAHPQIAEQYRVRALVEVKTS